MGILATDILIKTMLEGALADLRKNNWIVDDIFSDLATDPMAKGDYGYKEVAMAKEWFLANNIDVYLTNRIDTPRFPCITVVRLSSREMQERDALGDDHATDEFEPDGVTKQVQMVYSAFTPKAYNKEKGFVTLPDDMNTNRMLAGQFFVAKKSGKAYIIQKVLTDTQFQIAAGVNEDFTSAYIAPPTSIWNLEKELVFLEESFAIGIHAESDLNQAIWMRQLVQYIFLRYKEAYLERRGFELSTFNLGSIDINPHFHGAEMVYSCMMTVNGQVEANFIKYAAPKIQGVRGGIRIIDGPKTPEDYIKYVAKQGWKMEEDE
jgi:hypothetical protein